MQTENRLVIQCDGNVTECAHDGFSQVLEQMVTELSQAGRQIVSLSLDGTEMPLDQLVQINLQDVKEVSIRTQSADGAIAEILQTAVEYLPRLRGGLVQVASFYHAGLEHDGNELLQTALEGMVWVGTCVGGLSQFGTGIWHRQMGRLSDEYQDQLGRFLAALERMDFTEMSDLLEYELAETIAGMEEAVATQISQEKEQA